MPLQQGVDVVVVVKYGSRGLARSKMGNKRCIALLGVLQVVPHLAEHSPWCPLGPFAERPMCVTPAFQSLSGWFVYQF